MSKRKKSVSLQTIADQVGVSKYAVSLALNNKAGVSEPLRKQIIRVANEMGYVKSAKAMATKKLNIMVLIPEYIRDDTFFYQNIYWSIEKSIQEHGHTAIITSASEVMEKNLRLPDIFEETDIAGIIVVGQVSVPYMQYLLDTCLPCVSVDESYRTIDMDCVVSANEHGSFQMVQHLIDCGHTDIGFIGPLYATSSIYGRWVGYKKALEFNGLSVKYDHCITADSPKKSLLSDFDELSQYLDQLPSFPSAWFCSSDGTAATLLNILRYRGIQVPEDVSIVSFDDQSIAAMVSPGLTTYHVPREEMGRTAVQLLLARIAEHSKVCQEVSLLGYPVYRQTVKNLKK